MVLLLGAGVGRAEGQQLAAGHGDGQLAVSVGLHHAVFILDVDRDIDDFAGLYVALFRVEADAQRVGGGGKLAAARLAAVLVVGYGGEGAGGVLGLEDGLAVLNGLAAQGFAV